MLKKKIPLYTLLICLVIGILATYFITVSFYGGSVTGTQDDQTFFGDRSAYKVTRLSGFQFIKPIVSAKPAVESTDYNSIKKTLISVIENYRNQGIIESGSVYLRDFENSNWTGVNYAQKYMPGSLMKVPELMTFLRMEEEHPGTLSKVVPFYHVFTSDKTANILSKGIELGKSYSLRELLQRMIEFSDNNATFILNEYMDKEMFGKVFTDLGMEAPDWNKNTYPISASEYSVFMEALFNASYLTIKNSEYAVWLLTKCDYSDGIVKGIGVDHLLIAHKFGESGTNVNRELHESALFYINDKPFLLTVMTRGNNNVTFAKLAEVIQGIAGAVHTKLSAR